MIGERNMVVPFGVVMALTIAVPVFLGMLALLTTATAMARCT
jgi:hypothetical protein